MLRCPHSAERLLGTRSPAGLVWTCATCAGRATTLAVLRRSAEASALNGLWQAARIPGPTGCACPSCGKPMRAVGLLAEDEHVELDLCPRCSLVWFDRSERERLPAAEAPDASQSLSPAAEAAWATFRLESRRRAVAAPSARGPDEPWKLLPGLFGFPVEVEGHATTRAPVLTWALVGALLCAALLALPERAQTFETYAFRASLPWPGLFVTAVTYFFLHSGWVHLLGNAYFLCVFGDNVEESLGPARYGLLLLGASLAGAAAHAFTYGDVALVGASAGISGVVVYYALEFPRIRLGHFFFWGRLFLRSFWLGFSARTGLVFWILFQTIGFLLEPGNVSYAAHLGGAAVGGVTWLALRKPAAVAARPRRARRVGR